MTEIWIKVILPGMDAVRSSLQGRITEESFVDCSLTPVSMNEEQLVVAMNSAIKEGSPIKLFDPIQLLPHVVNGQIGTVTLPLIQALEPTVSTSYLWVSGGQVQWWAPIENDSKWQAVVAQTIHGIRIAGSDEMPPEQEEPEEESHIIRPSFR